MRKPEGRMMSEIPELVRKAVQEMAEGMAVWQKTYAIHEVDSGMESDKAGASHLFRTFQWRSKKGRLYLKYFYCRYDATAKRVLDRHPGSIVVARMEYHDGTVAGANFPVRTYEKPKPKIRLY